MKNIRSFLSHLTLFAPTLNVLGFQPLKFTSRSLIVRSNDSRVPPLHVKSTPEAIVPSSDSGVKDYLVNSSSYLGPSLKYGLMLSSFANGVLQHSYQQAEPMSSVIHPSKLFFRLSLSSILLKESINKIQDAIESSVKHSPCAGPDVDLLNLLEKGDEIHRNLNTLMESTFFESNNDDDGVTTNNDEPLTKKKSKSLDSVYSYVNDHNDVHDDMIEDAFRFIQDSSSKVSNVTYPPSIRILFIPTAMYALRKNSENSPGKQRQRNRADGKKRRNQLVQFIESLYLTKQEGEDKSSSTMDTEESWKYTNSTLNTCTVTFDLDDGSIKQPVATSYKNDQTNEEDMFPSDGEEALTEWKPHLIHVEGGNTFWLKHCLDKGNWSQLIKDACSSSNDCPTMYVGCSAGAIVAGKYVDVAKWKGWDDPSVVPGRETYNDWIGDIGLNMIGNDESFFPHMDESFEQLVKEKSIQLDDDIDDENYCAECVFTLQEDACYFCFQAEKPLE